MAHWFLRSELSAQGAVGEAPRAASRRTSADRLNACPTSGAITFPRLLLLALLLLAAIAASYPLWLPVAGYALVHDDGPGKAEIAVVLAGGYDGGRILKAGDLVRAGFVPAVLVSGPPGPYGVNEADLEIAFAVRHGFPRQWFIPLPNLAFSTREEARVVLPELRRRGVHSFLLVTSSFHTARATRIYRAEERAEGYAPAMRVVAAPDKYFHPATWWHNRESQKTAFYEWCKTVASALGD